MALDRSTLAFWVGYAAAEIAPVAARLRETLLASARLFADETRLPVLDPGRGRTKTGYFWTIARDDRAWGGADPPAVVYAYAPGRGQEHNDRLLGAYRGIVQCHGYATCKALAAPSRGEAGVTLVYCWAHARRGFYDLAKAGAAPIATEALARIAALYRIEADIRGKAAGHRLAVRRAKSRPLVADLRLWFEAQAAKLPARGPTAMAIRYALNHWDGLERFLDDGRIELDTNSVERAMRPVAMTRSLYPSLSGICKDWKLVLLLAVTRAGSPLQGSGNLVGLQVGHPNLVGRAGHDLFGCQQLVPDQPTDDVVADVQRGGRLAHRQPLAALLGRTVSVDVANPAGASRHGGRSTSCPGRSASPCG